jgi:hypothetical protein
VRFYTPDDSVVFVLTRTSGINKIGEEKTGAQKEAEKFESHKEELKVLGAHKEKIAPTE